MNVGIAGNLGAIVEDVIVLETLDPPWVITDLSLRLNCVIRLNKLWFSSKV